MGVGIGTATINPACPLTAGEYETLTFVYTAQHPIDDSGYVMIAFRQMSDFGAPQFDAPSEPNFCSVSTTGDCRIVPRWDPKGNQRPWSKALYLQIRFGYLDGGDEVSVVFGDTSRGSPGWRVQTFCEDTFEFRTYADPIATWQFRQLAASPEVAIIPGAPVSAVCIAPSQIRMGEGFTYGFRLEDRWGNPVREPLRLPHPGIGTSGVATVTHTDPVTRLSAVSNPIDVVETMPAARSYWADFHAQSEETIGSNSIDHYLRFARDYAFLDIVGHQGNDFQITDEFWEEVNQKADVANDPGSFVAFPGFEWSGNTPLGGDRNVYFPTSGREISRSSRELLPGRDSCFPDAPTAAALFDRLRGGDAFVFAHVGGRYADMRTHDEGLEVAVEVHSCWGTFEWLLEDALKQGYTVGVCANSDDHKSRPGAAHPGASAFGSYGGLTCVVAERLDRAAIADAVRRRSFYATTGHRPILSVQLCRTDGTVVAAMGQRVSMTDARSLVLNCRYVGTAPVEELVAKDGLDAVAQHRPEGDGEWGESGRIKVVWSGAEVRGRNRMATWDGCLRVSGNRILDVTAVNFWNPERPLERVGHELVNWQSVTTGGSSGFTMDLETACRGDLAIDTAQCQGRVDLTELAGAPRVWDAGGLGKELRVGRLADGLPSIVEHQFELGDLAPGRHAVYVRARQTDEHRAWSSPIYVECVG